MLFFEWDEQKAAANVRKHGIQFSDAVRVFEDELAMIEMDRVVDGEERWRTVGHAGQGKVLTVAYTVREDGVDEVMRIISARHSTGNEKNQYGENHQKIAR